MILSKGIHTYTKKWKWSLEQETGIYMMCEPVCVISRKKAGVQKMQEKGRKTEWSVYRMGNGKL